MKSTKRISAKMIPALGASSGTALVGDISSVPAVRVELKYQEQAINTVAIIDTGADLCILDKRLFQAFMSQQPKPLGKVVASGFSKKALNMYHLDINVFGDEPEQTLTFQHVPVIVTELDRQLFIIGRRGLLEWLRVELDFPRNQTNLIYVRRVDTQYPKMADEFPSFDSIVESFEAHQQAQGVMMLAWEMEKFLERLATEDPNLRTAFEKTPGSKITLREKLLMICHAKNAMDLSEKINQFVNARNMAAHNVSDEINSLPTATLLAATEEIVSRFSHIDMID